MPKKFWIILAATAGILFVLLYPQVYVVRGSVGGQLYWHRGEALIFVEISTSGTRVNYARYASEPLLLSFGHVRKPDDERCSEILVFQITDKSVQRYDTDLYRYAKEPYCNVGFQVFEDGIYASRWPVLWRWTGSHFERPTPEEYGHFASGIFAGKFESHPWQFDNRDGWSMRSFGQTPPQTQFAINGQTVSIVFSGETWPMKPLSIDLIRNGQSPQRLWQFDGRPRRVSRAEYGGLFQR